MQLNAFGHTQGQNILYGNSVHTPESGIIHLLIQGEASSSFIFRLSRCLASFTDVDPQSFISI